MHADLAVQAPSAANRQTELSAALMDQIDLGLAACDESGHLLQANAAARRELDRGDVLQLLDGRVQALGDNAAEFSAALVETAQHQRSRLLPLEHGERTLMVVMQPLRAGPPAAALLIGRRHTVSALGLEMLAMHHRLTLAEQRVLRALTAGRSAREIAAAHGVGLATVRTQIQSLRDKVGARGISDLILHAAQVPPAAPCLRLASRP